VKYWLPVLVDYFLNCLMGSDFEDWSVGDCNVHCGLSPGQCLYFGNWLVGVRV
jgi:hypothetical protein